MGRGSSIITEGDGRALLRASTMTQDVTASTLSPTHGGGGGGMVVLMLIHDYSIVA